MASLLGWLGNQAQGIAAQINPWDGGATYSSVTRRKKNEPIIPSNVQRDVNNVARGVVNSIGNPVAGAANIINPIIEAAYKTAPVAPVKAAVEAVNPRTQVKLTSDAVYNTGIQDKAEAFNQTLLGGLGRQTINTLGTANKVMNIPVNIATGGKYNQQVNNTTQRINNELFSEPGKKNSLSPTRLENYTPEMNLARTAGSGAKLVVDMASIGKVGNIANAGVKALPIVSKLAQGGKVAQVASKVLPYVGEAVASEGLYGAGQKNYGVGDAGTGIGLDLAFNAITKGGGRLVKGKQVKEGISDLLSKANDENTVAQIINKDKNLARLTDDVKTRIAPLLANSTLPKHIDDILQDASQSVPRTNVKLSDITLNDHTKRVIAGNTQRIENIRPAGTTIDTPIKLTRNLDGSYKIDDGNHRIAQAIKNGDETIIASISNPSVKIKKDSIVLPNVKTKEQDKQQIKVPLEALPNKNAIQELKRSISSGVVDKDARLIELAKKLEKQDPIKNAGLVNDMYYYTGLQRRSNAIANETVKQSENMNKAFTGLNKADNNEFSQFVAAKRGLLDAAENKKTNIDTDKLNAVVNNLSPKYQQRFDSLNKYYKEWAQKFYDEGIIDKGKYNLYMKNNDYTRIQRDMEDLVNQNQSGKAYSAVAGGVTKQKRKGSTREILPADQTAFGYAQQAQLEIQRNQAAKAIVGMLESNGMAKKVGDATNKNTLTIKRNGKVEHWEVPRDIKEVANNVSPYTLGVAGRIIAFPQRVLRAGATGLNPVFTAANYAKDQASSAIFSKDIVNTSLKPQNVASGLWNAAKDTVGTSNDPIWQKFITHMGDDTQYYGIRNIKNAKVASRELRRPKAGKVGNVLLHPINSLEDLNSITEKATRFQHFKGVYQDALKKTGSEAEATKAATLAAWQNSVDFSRMGDVTRITNLLIPYFNAGVQGTRLLTRRMKENPVGTSAKILTVYGLPLAAITAYNLRDEAKDIYNNIADYEKEGNMVVVLPGAKQNAQGTYEGVIKIPLQPGLSDLVQPIRRGMESFGNNSPVELNKIAGDILGAVSGPVETKSLEAFAGSLIPQAVKPTIQSAMNRDFFKGTDIVPDYIENAYGADGNPVSEPEKAYKQTSGSARLLGNLTNTSPIKVDKFIQDTTGAVGKYTQKFVDENLAKLGVIPQEQVGGRSIVDDFQRRFTEASGKENYNKSEGAKYYDKVEKITEGLTAQEKTARDTLHPSKKNFLGEVIYDQDSTYDSVARLDVYNRFPKVYEADKKLDAMNRSEGKPGNPLFDLEGWQLKKVLEKEALPKGAKDPELSQLYKQDWYAEYRNKKTDFFSKLKKQAESEGREFSSSDNPYPETPNDIQKTMDYYNSLPKGTGARSKWIQSNPELFNQMKNQWASVDAWENNEREKRGLARTEGAEGEALGYGDSPSYSNYSRGSGSSKPKVSTAGFKTASEGKIKIPTGIKVKKLAYQKAKTKKLPISKMPKIA